MYKAVLPLRKLKEANISIWSLTLTSLLFSSPCLPTGATRAPTCSIPAHSELSILARLSPYVKLSPPITDSVTSFKSLLGWPFSRSLLFNILAPYSKLQLKSSPVPRAAGPPLPCSNFSFLHGIYQFPACYRIDLFLISTVYC